MNATPTEESAISLSGHANTKLIVQGLFAFCSESPWLVQLPIVNTNSPFNLPPFPKKLS